MLAGIIGIVVTIFVVVSITKKPVDDKSTVVSSSQLATKNSVEQSSSSAAQPSANKVNTDNSQDVVALTKDQIISFILSKGYTSDNPNAFAYTKTKGNDGTDVASGAINVNLPDGSNTGIGYGYTTQDGVTTWYWAINGKEIEGYNNLPDASSLK